MFKDIQRYTWFHPNCRSFSASTSNSLDRRTASGWLPSSRASETHFFHLFCHYFFLDHHHWDRNHDWKLPLLFFVLEFCQAGFGNLFGRPPPKSCCYCIQATAAKFASAWLEPGCFQPAVRERVTHVINLENPQGGLFLHLERHQTTSVYIISMAEVLRSPHSPSRGTMGGPTATQHIRTKTQIINTHLPKPKVWD